MQATRSSADAASKRSPLLERSQSSGSDVAHFLAENGKELVGHHGEGAGQDQRDSAFVSLEDIGEESAPGLAPRPRRRRAQSHLDPHSCCGSTLLERCTGEFVGTFLLMLCGTGVCTVVNTTGSPNGGVIAPLTWMLILVGLIYVFRKFSGAFFNPAVAFGFYLTGGLPLVDMLVYSVVQFVAALLGTGAAVLVVPVGKAGLIGQTQLMTGVSLFQGVVLEVFQTFFLVIVAFFANDPQLGEASVSPLAVAAVVGCNSFWGGPLTGASMNPARSFGPAVVRAFLEPSKDQLVPLQLMWLYILAPYVGAALGFLLYALVRRKDYARTEPDDPFDLHGTGQGHSASRSIH